MADYEQRERNRAKRRKFIRRHPYYDRERYRRRRAKTAILRTPGRAGGYAVWVRDGSIVWGRDHGGRVLLSGLSATVARGIATALGGSAVDARRRGPEPGRGGQPVVRIGPDGAMATFASIRAASRAVGVSRQTIGRRVCDGCADYRGYSWIAAGPGLTRLEIA
jgi:hypothetical protein